MKHILNNDNNIFSVLGKQHCIEQYIHGSIQYDSDTYTRTCMNFIKIISMLDKLCANEYWLIGGSLLGTIRNKCVLPWDDDIDIAITTIGYSVILENIHTYTTFTIIQNMIGFKLYDGDMSVADIFIIDYIDDTQLVYSGPYINEKSHYILHECFPKIIFTYEDIYPLLRYECCGIYVNIPRNYKKLLIQNYNEKAFNEIKFPYLGIHNNLFDSRFAHTFYYELFKYLVYSDNNENIIHVIKLFLIKFTNYNMNQYI